jgi:all-trans-retinol 13,14-reductase
MQFRRVWRNQCIPRPRVRRMSRSAIVIGAGVSGMSSALLLARHGYSVQLIEKAPTLAPLVRGFSRQGIHFDTGFHHTGYLEPGEMLDRAFTLMGLNGLETLPLGHDDDQCVHFDDDAHGCPLPSGFSRVLDTLGGFFPQERSSLTRYLDVVRAAQESSPYLNPDAISKGEIGGDESLADVLDSLFADARLKALLASQTLYHGVPPAQVPFVFHARVGAAGLRSLRAVVGGGKNLVRAFSTALNAAGVQVSTGSGVAAILPTPAGAFGSVVLENDRRLEADVCMFTAHPAILASLVPDGVFRPAYVHRLTRMPETPQAVMLFGSIPDVGEARPGRTWLFLDGLEPSRWFGCDATGRPASMSVMISPGAAKKGRVGVEIAISESGQTCSKRERTDALMEHFSARMPAIASAFELLDAADSSTFARYANSPYGSYYGPSHALGVHPPQPRTRFGGLYLAGQAVVAPGVAGAVISACVAVDVLLGSGLIAEDLARC